MSDATDRAELIHLQSAWMDAWVRRDRAALEAIVATDFSLTSARSDRVMERADWLETALGRARGHSFEYRDFRVQVHGDAAVVKSRMIQEADVDGVPWSGEFMLTDVWFRRDGRWQVVARHSSTPPTKEF